jgi:non-heme chloroperoxidase
MSRLPQPSSTNRQFIFRSSILGLIAAFLATGCASSIKITPYSDPAPHTSSLASVAPGLRLHYLDFGGSGEALILLAGSGNSAHIFDDFAPLLIGHFHVFALTRRGFGESSRPDSGYDTKTLAEDILAFVDLIGAPRADIVGHSIAGAEMTRFANDHPDRVNRLVYLDAAYDWLSNSELKTLSSPPTQPGPGAADVSSSAAFSAYWARMEGVAVYPEAEIRATWSFDDDGRLLAPTTPAAVSLAVAAGAAAFHPDYAEVLAPSLAIFTVPDSAEDMFPWLSLSPSEAQGAKAYFAEGQAALAARRESFRSTIPRGSIIERHGLPHYLFLYEPERTASEIIDFLLQ